MIDATDCLTIVSFCYVLLQQQFPCVMRLSAPYTLRNFQCERLSCTNLFGVPSGLFLSMAQSCSSSDGESDQHDFTFKEKVEVSYKDSVNVSFHTKLIEGNRFIHIDCSSRKLEKILVSAAGKPYYNKERHKAIRMLIKNITSARDEKFIALLVERGCATVPKTKVRRFSAKGVNVHVLQLPQQVDVLVDGDVHFNVACTRPKSKLWVACTRESFENMLQSFMLIAKSLYIDDDAADGDCADESGAQLVGDVSDDVGARSGNM